MIQFVDLHHPALVAALLNCPPGMALELAAIPAGGKVHVRDGRWLTIDDGKDEPTITLELGGDAEPAGDGVLSAFAP